MHAALLSLMILAAEPEAEVKLLKTFVEEFVLLTPGEGRFPKSFEMGRADGGDAAERPARKVTLGRPFSIAKYEVPQNLWEAVMGDNPSRWKGPRNSVEMLTYDDAVAFCQKATARLRESKLIAADQVVRLPTEAEWEYAARAGTTTVYSFGDDAGENGKTLKEYGWYTGNAAGNDPPVGAKKPNAWGLYDMHGYLWEFCSDAWHDSHADGPTDGSARPLGKDTDPKGAKFVIRSGSWKDQAEQLTSTARRGIARDAKDDAVGLRCVLTQPLALASKSAQFKPTAQAGFVPAASKLELLWNEGEFTEGPAAAPDGTIYFTDIGNRILRFDPQTKKVEVYRSPSGRANGLKFDPLGRLIACEGAAGGNRRVSITEKDGTVRTLADNYDKRKFNSPNDLAIAADGTIFFTDPRYGGDEPRELSMEGVFRVTPDGTVRLATRDVQKPNGIIALPDGKKVLVSDSNSSSGGNRQLVELRVQPDGSLADKKVLYDFGDGRGIDGMCLDIEGNIYATAGTGERAGIHIFSPTGQPLAFIKTPGDPTNCVFGRGDEATTLYLTAGLPKDQREKGKFGLYRIPLTKRGYHVPQK